MYPSIEKIRRGKEILCGDEGLAVARRDHAVVRDH